MNPSDSPVPAVEGRLRQALEATTDCVLVLDRAFRIVFVNRRAAHLVGRKVEDLVGRTHWEAWPSSLGTEVERRYRLALANGASQEFEHHYVGEGLDLWLEIHAHPSEDGLTVFYRDVTRRRRERHDMAQLAEESERQKRLYEAVLSNTPDLEYVFDLDHRFVYANAALLRMWGMTAEEALGKNCLEIGYEPWHAEMHDREIEQVVATKRPIRGVVPFNGTNGRRMYDYIFAPVIGEDGEVEAVAGTTRDVTDRVAAENALREGQDQYRQIAEGLPQMVWSARADGVRDYFNARWHEYTGVGLKQSENPWLQALHPDDEARAARAWRLAVASGETFQAEYRLGGKDGRYRWFLGRAIPLRDETNGIVRWFGTCTDIDEQKSAQRTLEIANEFARTLASDLDPERIVQALTDATCQAIGAEFGSFFFATPEVAPGPDGSERFGLYVLSGAPREAFAGFPPVRSTPLFTPTFNGQGVVRSDDVTKDPRFSGMPEGHLPVRSYLATPVRGRDGAVLGGLLFGHSDVGRFGPEQQDLVESFAAQASVAYENAVLYERLRDAKEGLERRVEERTAELTRANRDLNEFSYSVAHDLRAPLRAIVSTSRILLEDAGERLNEEEREALERQATNAVRLAKIVDDLLGFARLAKADLRKVPFDFSRIARTAADEVTRRREGNCGVEVQDGIQAVGDPNLLGYVLTNLIDNACKFSPNGGRVQVGQSDGAFFVRDQGIGFDMQHAHKLFVAFERLVGQERFEGTGVGLANVKRIVERHGGRVWAESQPGHGSTFYFTLA